MGISGLLPSLSTIKKPVHIKEYAGKVVAIDGHCWLHQGAISCAMDLALGKPTTKYITYFIRRIEMLQFYKVIPYVVFDGQPLPIKESTNKYRSIKREEGRTKALELLKSGQGKEAYKYFQQSISITPSMIESVISKLDEINVKHIVAPYEADAQLTFLIQNHIVDAVITEDSDLIPFGCSNVIFKMDQYGEGTLIRLADIQTMKEFRNFSLTHLRRMCILSGCDYLPSLRLVGLKTAQKLISKFANLKMLMNSLSQKHATYEQEFSRAEQGFLYQYVYDPIKRTYIRLNPLVEGICEKDLSHLGEYPDHQTNTLLQTNQSTNIIMEAIEYCDKNKENLAPNSESKYMTAKKETTLGPLSTKTSKSNNCATHRVQDSLQTTKITLSDFEKSALNSPKNNTSSDTKVDVANLSPVVSPYFNNRSGAISTLRNKWTTQSKQNGIVGHPKALGTNINETKDTRAPFVDRTNQSHAQKHSGPPPIDKFGSLNSPRTVIDSNKGITAFIHKQSILSYTDRQLHSSKENGVLTSVKDVRVSAQKQTVLPFVNKSQDGCKRTSSPFADKTNHAHLSRDNLSSPHFSNENSKLIGDATKKRKLPDEEPLFSKRVALASIFNNTKGTNRGLISHVNVKRA